jgi:hypothetical protein
MDLDLFADPAAIADGAERLEREALPVMADEATLDLGDLEALELVAR